MGARGLGLLVAFRPKWRLKHAQLPLLLALGLGLSACPSGPQVKPDSPTGDPAAQDAPQEQAPPVPLTMERQRELEAIAQSVLANSSFTVPVVARPSVLQIIHHMQTNSDARLLMEAALTQGATFRPDIEAALVRDGLPPELSFIAQAESAFIKPDLKGKGLAVGLWQMIPSTARHYGLVVNETVDNRTEAFKATDAAVRHLVDLYATFNDWPLAITSFYAGAGIVEHGLEMSGTQDAWGLIEDPAALPREARGYLPLVYAQAIISQDPGKFGFKGALSDAELAIISADFERYYTHRYPMELTFGGPS